MNALCFVGSYELKHQSSAEEKFERKKYFLLAE